MAHVQWDIHVCNSLVPFTVGNQELECYAESHDHAIACNSGLGIFYALSV